jgi:DNA-directed RNA polymerase specialized sigma24 family protein
MKGRVQNNWRDWDREVYSEEEAIATDKAVGALPQDLRKAVFEHYILRGTVQQQCESLEISKSTLYERLDRANTLLLGLLNDIAAGLEPRV